MTGLLFASLGEQRGHAVRNILAVGCGTGLRIGRNEILRRFRRFFVLIAIGRARARAGALAHLALFLLLFGRELGGIGQLQHAILDIFAQGLLIPSPQAHAKLRPYPKMGTGTSKIRSQSPFWVARLWCRRKHRRLPNCPRAAKKTTRSRPWMPAQTPT